MKRIIALLTMYLTLSAGYAQNVGVGNTNPHTKLEVTGAISSTPVSSTAAGAVQVPDNVSVFMLTAVAGYQDNILTTVTPQEGQYLTIYNEDDDTASFSGYAISPLSGVASFTYIHSGWRMVSNNNIRTVADTGAYIKSQTSFDQPTGFRIGGNGFFNGGRIGMNISSPLYAVHINHNSFTDGLMLQNTSGGNTNIYMANYNDLIPGVSRPGASISAQNDGSYSASMVFATKQPGADANPLTERMRIRSNGNVGIGTNAPQQKLDVAGTAKMSGFQMPSPTAIKGYVMTTDTSGNGTWQGSELTQMASGIFDGSCIDSVGIATANGFGTFYVAASGSYAYVINYNSGSMNIFNISNRAAPTIVSTLPLSLSGISGIAVSGSYVYVISQFSNVLNTYNVSNPSAPTLVVSTPLTAGNNPAAIVVSGAYLYISCLGSGASLLIYNISNPTSPSLAGGYGVGGINFLAVSGAYAYGVSQGGRYMIIYNIINPSSPTQLSFTSLGSNAPVAVVASGSYVYVGLSNGTIATYNVSNPAAPVLAGSVFSGTNNGMAILGSYMAVTGTNNTLTLYNISNPASPVLVRSMPTGPMPRAVTFSGANILVTNFNNRTLEIFGPTCSVSTAVTLQSTNGSLTMQSMSVGNSSIGNNLSTTINGTTGSSVPIINTNSLSVSGNYLTSVVNGISSNALNIGATVNANIYNHDGTLDSTRTLIQNDKPLTFATTSNTNGLFLQNLNGGIGTPANLFFSTYPDQAPGVKYPGASISGVDDGLYSAHLTFGTKLTGTDANPIAERMRLTSAGNLGIGNTAPAYALHVGNSTDTTDRYITVDASAAKATALQFNSAGIQSWKMYRPGSSSDLRLYGGGADRITFQNSGNVGIGNISPSYALHIGTATDATDRYIAIDAAAAQSTALQLNSAGSQSWKIYRPGGSGDLRLFAGGADRATFQSTGNVGIGNTAPAYTLHVGTGTDATDRYITIDAASAQATALQLNSGGTQSWKIYRPGASTDLRLFGNGADRVTFKNNGNVGIGTTSPGQALTVNGSGGIWNSNQVNFYTDAGTTQKGFLGMQSGSDMMLASSTASNWMRIGANNGSIAFFPDNTITSGANPKVVIASSGNVGIGTVTPGSLLYVGNGTTTSNTYVTIDASAGQQSAIQFSSGGAQSWVMYRPGGSSDLRFYGNGADRMTMQAGGNVGIGTSNPTQAMLVVNGIASGGNQNLGNYHYYASGGNGNSNGAIDISVYATNRMVASEFDATSDRRIKKDLMHSESSCDLATLAGLQVTDFKYVDAVSNGKDYKKGFIAQEVERVFPEAVQKHIDFIPSIYSLSTDAKYIASTKELHIMMAKPHGLKQGDVVRIMSEADEDNIYTVAAVINEREFAVKDWTKDMVNSVFVYGKRVDDFRTVDYDRIYTLNVSATQELYRIIREQQQTIAGQQSENKTMKSDIDHLKASVETLQQIIGSKAEK